MSKRSFSLVPLEGSIYFRSDYLQDNSAQTLISITTKKEKTSVQIFKQFEDAVKDGDVTKVNELVDKYPSFSLSTTNDFRQNLVHTLAITCSCRGSIRIKILNALLLLIVKECKNEISSQEYLKKVHRDKILLILSQKDFSSSTPLHYACNFKRKSLINWFISNKFLHNIFDENASNMSPFHYIVDSQTEFVELAQNMFVESGIKIQELQKFQKFSPLHIAAKSASIEMIKFLNSIEFSFNEYDYTENGFSPLHYAIMYLDDDSISSIERVNFFMEKTSYEFFRTEKTKDSLIHIAAMYGKPKILDYLLIVSLNTLNQEERNASVNIIDDSEKEKKLNSLILATSLNAKRQTCLHVIPSETVSIQSIDLECVKIIVNHPSLINDKCRERFILKRDEDDKTALELAANIEIVKICEIILSSLECKPTNSWIEHENLLKLYQKVPDSLIEVYKKCLTKKDFCMREERISGELAPIVGRRLIKETDSLPESYYLSRVSSLSNKIRNKVLENQLVELFINEKFKKISPILIIGCILQMTYIILFTMLAYIIYDECDIDEKYKILSNGSNNESLILEQECAISDFSNYEMTMSVLIILIAFIFILKELLQIFSARSFKNYLLDYTNIFQWLFIIMTIFSTALFFLTYTNGQGIDAIYHKANRVITVISVLIGGVLSLYELKKISKFGEFSRIFRNVAKNSLFLFGFYLILLMSFMVSFKILSPKNDSNYAIPNGFGKIISMMVGEFEFNGNFESSNDSAHYIIISKLIVYILFIFIGAIVGLNLLIGLAVEDIQALRAEARTEILSTKLDQIYMIEKFIISLKPYFSQTCFRKILDWTNVVVISRNMKKDLGYYETIYDFKNE